MPHRSKRPCGHPFCHVLTHKPYCERHQRERNQQRGPSPYGYKWRTMRAAQLKRQPLCQHCLEQGKTTAATEADHVVPHRGDPDLFNDPDNLQSLCKSCHSRKTRSEMNAY